MFQNYVKTFMVENHLFRKHFKLFKEFTEQSPLI